MGGVQRPGLGDGGIEGRHLVSGTAILSGHPIVGAHRRPEEGLRLNQEQKHRQDALHRDVR